LTEFLVEHTVDVAAPAEVVWQVLTDLPRYPDWNPFQRRCRGSLEPGSPIAMQARLGRVWVFTVERMLTVDPGVGFSYAMYPLPFGLLHSLRSHALESTSPVTTRYHSRFELSGRLVSVVAALLGTPLRTGFAAAADALVVRAQSLAGLDPSTDR
jgi:hypothetical protein